MRRALEAFKTGDAVLLPIALRVPFRDRSYWTFPHTLLTLSTIIRYNSFKNSETGKDRKERSQRAEVTAPEPLPDDSQNKDDDEEDEDKKIDFKQGQRNGRYDEWIPGKEAMDPWQEVVIDEDSGREKGNDQCPGDQADGVEEIHHLPGHETRDHGKDKDPVAKPPERLIAQSPGPFLFPEKNSVEEIDRSAHRAEPTTEKITKDENEEEHPEGREHPHDDLFLRKNRDDPDEGIESKIEINRYLQFKGEGGSNDQIEKEKEGKGLNRPSQVRDCPVHVALTFFTRTFERSISPSLKS
jgi:hypothetical protein